LTGTAVGVGVALGVAVAVLVCVGGGVSVGGSVAVAEGVKVMVGEGTAVELGTSVGNGSVATAARATSFLTLADSVGLVCWQLLPTTISSRLKAKNNRFIMLPSKIHGAIVAEGETAVK
jgi:hypothetical protein